MVVSLNSRLESNKEEVNPKPHIRYDAFVQATKQALVDKMVAAR